MTTPGRAARRRQRRVQAHQCSACRRHWALRLIDHPAGPVVVCRFCGAVRIGERLHLVPPPPG